MHRLADPNTKHFAVEACRFMTGKYSFMMAGLPGAAYAMYRCAKPEKRKIVGGLLFSAALTSFLTGITEPIEFTFLFIAPGLFILHLWISRFVICINAYLKDLYRNNILLWIDRLYVIRCITGTDKE